MSTTEHKIKITYIPAQFRIRVELTKADVLASPTPPTDIMERAKRKLEAEVTAGRLAFYRFFEVRLHAIWKKLQHADVPDDAIVGVSLATGAPPMPGLRVIAGEGGVLGLLSIGAEPEVIADWRFPLFKLTVGKILKDLGIKEIADPAQLQSLFLKAALGNRVIKQPISALPSFPEHKESARILRAPENGDIAVVIYDVTGFHSEEAIAAWTEELATKIREAEIESGRTYRFLRSDVIRTLRSAYRGVERFGLDLPMKFLAAYCPTGPSLTQGVRRGGAQIASRLRGVCELDISDGSMVARIASFHYEKFNVLKPVSIEDWTQYFAALGVVHGICATELQRFHSGVIAEQPVDGITIARGTDPQSASGPTLHAVYNQPAQKATDVSFRDAQQKLIVRKGDVIAEVRYEEEAVAGINVYGAAISPPPPPILEVETSDGVDTPDGVTYIATTSGMPSVSENRIDLIASLVFEGDVNLTSGNIYFDGSGEINGNIESGSRVEVTGDLHVKGMVHAAHVRCGGNLVVENGIIGDEGSLVQVQGNLEANFIENATIRCRGDLTVKKAVIGCRITCNSIKVIDAESLIAGGRIEAWNAVEVANLGRSGSDTTVVAGCQPDMAKRIQNLENRLLGIVQLLQKEKFGAGYVEDKEEVRRSKKQQQRLVGMKARIPRLKRIIRHLQSRIHDLRTSMLYNDEAMIVVRQTLSSKCRIEIAGKNVSASTDLQAVKIQAKLLKGSHIRPLVDAHKEAG